VQVWVTKNVMLVDRVLVLVVGFVESYWGG